MKKNSLTEGRLLPSMLLFSTPLILSSVLQTLYNAADAFIVGRYDSANALAAVGSVGACVNTVINLFMGLSVGTNVLVARYRGAKDEDLVKKTSDTAIITALISGIIFGLLGYFAAKPMAYITKIDPEIFDLAVTYMQIYFLGMPFISLYNFIAAILRGTGDTKNPMISLIISGAVNVVLNIVFVKFFGMGVAGVALATVISQAVGFIIIYEMLKKSDVGFSLKNIVFDKKIFKLTTKIGIPAGIQGLSFSASNMLMMSAINSFGAAAVAGNAVVSQAEGILYVIINSFSQVVTTFTSQNLGAGKLKRITPIMLWGFFLSITIAGFLSGVAFYFKDFIIEAFAPGDAEVAKTAITKFYCIVIPYVAISFIEIPSGSLRGIGATFTAMMLSIFGVCGFRILWLIFLFPVFNTVSLLFLVYPASWLFTGALYILAYAILKKRLDKSKNLLYA